MKAHFSCIAKEKDIPNMPIELDLLDRLKTRVQLAKKIDTSQHRLKKQKHEKNWLREAAEAMEIEIDSDFSDAYVADSRAYTRTETIFLFSRAQGVGRRYTV